MYKYFLLVTLITLIGTCPIGCTGCHAAATGSQTCTGCVQGRYLQWKFNNTVQRCPKCHIGCVDCTNEKYNCTACVSQEFFMTANSNCWKCSNAHEDIGTCIQCLSQSDCLLCGNDSYMAPTINNKTLCYYCAKNCTGCVKERQCTGCTEGFYFQNDVCPQVCGDAVSHYFDCDLELGIDLDGCTDNCQLEQNFSCYVNDTETVCSYNGTFSISTVSVEKDLFSNALTIIFNIVPFIYTFQSVSATDFVSYNDTTF